MSRLETPLFGSLEIGVPRHQVDQEAAILKARVLVETLPWFQRFRDKVFVVKLGGAAMESPELTASVLRDVVLLEQNMINPVLVHGGGNAASAAMKAAGLVPRFVSGLRATDAAALPILREVLVDRINADLRAKIEGMGGKAAGVFPGGEEALAARPHRPLVDGASVDLGLVGEPVRANRRAFRELFKRQVIPVVAPLVRGEEGEILNVNADSVASFLAGELDAEKLVLLSNTHGVRVDPADPESYASHLSRREIDDLIARGIISGGMLPKVRAALQALERGVDKAHIIDGRIPHSLLLEIFTDEGVGTEIVA